MTQCFLYDLIRPKFPEFLQTVFSSLVFFISQEGKKPIQKEALIFLNLD